MEETKLSDDVIEQIIGFTHWKLTEEQKLLINKLILNDELKYRYKNNGLCKECKQPNTNDSGYCCQPCNAKHFQQNFKNWTSGNHNVDEFIRRTQINAQTHHEALEWIEYDRFENVTYLAEGGFGTINKAIWKDGYIERWDSENNQWKRKDNFQVALKCLHNSQNITSELLKEIEFYLINISGYVVKCWGISKDPDTNNFIMVMQYAENGSLRHYLNNKFNSLDWSDKLQQLKSIAHGLDAIHDNGLIHHDFHCGNILSEGISQILVTDLGLCRPLNAQSDKNIYGVLPYVAPEVLRGKEYTQASDIYGFGIIAYEVCTGLPPYHDIAHKEFLAIRVCQGLRPKSNYKIPQLILDIINQCWDADPLKRPKAKELWLSINYLYNDANYRKKRKKGYDKNLLINKQIKETDKINKQLTSSTASSSSSSTSVLSYTTHSQAVYTSRLLDFKNLPEPKNADDDDDDDELEYSVSTRVDFTKFNINTKDENN